MPVSGASAADHPHDEQAIRRTPHVRYLRYEDRLLPGTLGTGYT